jgi:hypothetical protein
MQISDLLVLEISPLAYSLVQHFFRCQHEAASITTIMQRMQNFMKQAALNISLDLKQSCASVFDGINIVLFTF